jgi:microcystin-dependent protein
MQLVLTANSDNNLNVNGTITSDSLSSNSIITNTINTSEINSTKLNLTDDLYINNNIYFPIGSVIMFSGIISPSGWLLCDGSEVSKITYPRLYSVIGTLYGTPINLNNFVLPNLVDRVPVGKNNLNNVGNTGGNSIITLEVSQLPSHVHNGTTDSNGSHTHSITDPGHTHSQLTNQDDYNEWGGAPPGFTDDSGSTTTWNNINSSYTGVSINSSGSHSHTITTDSTGNNSQIDIRNKFIVLNYIIRY